MDIHRSEFESLAKLAQLWKTTPGAEFEALLTGLDITAWQDVVQYLRGLGMKETQQLIKLNITLANNIRFTLEGSGAIQAYCRDNQIADKPFTAMIKEDIPGAEPVQIESYAARAKLKRETPLAPTDARVKDAISRWDTYDKHFRNIQRFEFVAPNRIPIRFDISVVRENTGRPARTFQEAHLTTSAPRYEIEVELTADRAALEPNAAISTMLRGLSWILQGRQRSYVLISQQKADLIRDSVSAIFNTDRREESAKRWGNRNRAGPRPSFRFPGPQPATLERRHIAIPAEPGAPNLLTMEGGYNVTDKADGLRCLLYVADGGMIYLVDGGGRVYATGKRAEASQHGLVLDGEWIRRNREGTAVSHFMAFDILAMNSNREVASFPFKVPPSPSNPAPRMRDALLNAAVKSLMGAAQTLAGMPATQNLQVGVKTFRSATGMTLFREAATTLEVAKGAAYNTDGLIFTPNAAPNPVGRGTWLEQLKWKPPHENTIDFLVIVDRERTKTGEITGVDAVSTAFREDTGQTVRFKTLRLFVGSSRDVAFADPRRTVLGGEPLPTTLHEGDWHEVEFRPTEPRDPMASVCYAPLGAESVGDEMGEEGDAIRCSRTGDIIQSNMIVEMAYHPERAPGWRWEPVRVRHDKTERWLAQQAEGAARRGGTMNADWVANAIWTSIHNPVTEDTIRTGILTECAAPATLVAASSYSVRRAPMRDLVKTQCMRNFHTEYIKKRMLLGTTLKEGVLVCDLAMGNGSTDIPAWIAAKVRGVIGCDASATSLNEAYRRLMDTMISLGGRDRAPPMVFAQADVSRPLKTGEAGFTTDDGALLKRAFGPGGDMAGGADIVSCMYALNGMCRDEATLDGFLNNLADTVKVGGLFVGCALDGDAVMRAFVAAGGSQMIIAKDGAVDTWTMTRHFDTELSPTAAGLGLSVDLDFIAEGERRTEVLMSWPYIQSRLAEVGLELLTEEEWKAMGLPASSQMFGDSWAIPERKYEMTESLKRLSFMHRWWIMRRRSDARPRAPLQQAPVVETKAAPLSPSVQIGYDFSAPKAAPQFVVNGAAVTKEVAHDPENRLGAALADWPFYLSLSMLFNVPDMKNPAVVYPSVEAAITAAFFQVATTGPQLAPTIFGTTGEIHKKFEAARVGKPYAAQEKTIAEESVQFRNQLAPKVLAKYGITTDISKWNEQKEVYYKHYIAERYRNDRRFREMLQAIKRVGGELLYVNGKAVNEMGVGMDEAGHVLGGGNKIGRWMMDLVV